MPSENVTEALEDFIRACNRYNQFPALAAHLYIARFMDDKTLEVRVQTVRTLYHTCYATAKAKEGLRPYLDALCASFDV